MNACVASSARARFGFVVGRYGVPVQQYVPMSSVVPWVIAVQPAVEPGSAGLQH